MHLPNFKAFIDDAFIFWLYPWSITFIGRPGMNEACLILRGDNVEIS